MSPEGIARPAAPAAPAATTSATSGTASSASATASSGSSAPLASAAPDAGAGDAGVVDTRPRLGSIDATTWIYTGKKRQGKIGYIRAGTSVVLREPAPWEPTKKNREWGGCKSGKWWAIEPRGFVCDDDTVTRDLEAPLFQALALAGPKPGAYPFDYAFSTGAPMYQKVPVAEEQQKAERRFRQVSDLGKIRKMTTGHEDLAEPGPVTPEGIPASLADHAFFPQPPGSKGKPPVVRKRIPHGSMLSFARAFEAEGRTFLLSPDLTLIPADRMRPFRRTAFHGVVIGQELPLPIGWFRKKPRPKIKRSEGGAFEETGESWAPKTFVGLTGKTVEAGGVTYVETREAGLFARASDVSVVSAPEALPREVGEGEKWVDVSLRQGTLTLFEGKKAVYSTLMSPGAGGVTPKVSMTVQELVRAALTPLGTYRVWMKHRAAPMTSEDSPDPSRFWISDVPWVQYFRPPFAIHSAYWHEDFGMPKSGGCINLAPEDAKVVFEFTEPHVPETWWGAASRKDTKGTWIHIRK